MQITFVIDKRQQEYLSTTSIARLPHVHFLFPWVASPYACHHTKLMLIFFATGVRVVICTANLLDYDWLMKNQGVWVQDFPLLTPSTSSSSTTSTTSSSAGDPSLHEFRNVLQQYLHGMQGALRSNARSPGYAALTPARLALYEFRAAKVRLVHSLPGSYEGASACRSGIGRLAALVRQDMKDNTHHEHAASASSSSSSSLLSHASFSRGSGSPSEESKSKTVSHVRSSPSERFLIAQCSSIGSWSEAALQEFEDALLPPHEPAESSTSSSSTSKSSNSSKTSSHGPSRLRLVWPSHTDVETSIEGLEGGRSLPFTAKNCTV